MKVLFSGGNKAQRQTCRQVAQWMCTKLKLDRFKEEIWVDFVFSKELRYRPHEDVALAYTQPSDNYSPRDFAIEVAFDTPPDGLVETVIHEMVHVEQLATNRFRIGTTIATWEKVHYPIDHEANRTSPWEADAYTRTEQYMKEYHETFSRHVS